MFDFKKIPSELVNRREMADKKKPSVTIITPFYNAGQTLQQTVNSVLSQTYPYYEWIIIDDGSKDKKSLKELEKVSKLDSRIKVFHKENGGPSLARDFGISKASKTTKYVYFLDADDIIDKTMIECLYWSLETHPDASFAYTAMANFGAKEFIWDKYLTIEQQKKENLICISSMVRKEDLLEVGCFGIKEKAMYEDWNLWLKLIAAGKKPLRINEPLFWYRTSETGELSRAKENHEKAMKYVDETAKKIVKPVEIIQFPRVGNSYGKIVDLKEMVLPTYKQDGRKTILFLVPWMVTGGADLFNLDILKRLNKKEFKSIIITTLPANNNLRQEFDTYADEIYDLSTFLDRKDYPSFVEYIINSRRVNTVFLSNSSYGYAMLPMIKEKFPKISIIDYVHSVDLKAQNCGFGGLTKEFDEFIDMTYTCNNFTTEQLKKDFNKKDVKTLYIGTDHKRFDAKKYNKVDLLNKYNVPTDKKIISFVARLSEEKRPETFIELAKKLLEERDDLYFVIAGDGVLYNSVASKISKYNLKANISMLGTVNNPEEIYAISDITVNCSRLEGLALTSYESLSMGVPVVSADVGGQKELIDDSVGKIVEFSKDKKMEINNYYNAINYVLSNLTKLKKNARKKISDNFNLDKTIRKLESIFVDVKPLDNKKVGVSKLIYDLYMRTMEADYKWFCNEYMMKNYGVSLYREEMINNSEVTLTKKQEIKLKLAMLSDKFNIRNEATVILNFIRNIINLFRGIYFSIIFFVKAIIALVKIVLKVIKKIVLKIIK